MFPSFLFKFVFQEVKKKKKRQKQDKHISNRGGSQFLA